MPKSESEKRRQKQKSYGGMFKTDSSSQTFSDRVPFVGRAFSPRSTLKTYNPSSLELST